MARRQALLSTGPLVREHQESTYPVTFRIMERLQNLMQADVVASGYGLKGKSRWGREAIEGFLKDPSWKDQVLETEGIGGHQNKEVFYLTGALREQLVTAHNEAMRYAIESTRESGREELINTLNISKSSVIRAAISWRVFGLKMTRVDSTPQLPFD